MIIIFFVTSVRKPHKLDEIALKNLIRNNVSPTDSNSKIKLIMYNPKFNTINLIICNNFSPSTNYLSKTKPT